MKKRTAGPRFVQKAVRPIFTGTSVPPPQVFHRLQAVSDKAHMEQLCPLILRGAVLWPDVDNWPPEIAPHRRQALSDS